MQRFLLGAAAIAALATPASAVVVTFTDRAAFTAAAGTTAIETFNSYTTDVPFGTGLTVGAFTLSGTPDPQTAIDAATTSYPFLSDGTPFLLTAVPTGQKLVFTFSTALTAFGLDLDGFNDTFGASDIYLNGSALGVSVGAPTTVRFFGFTSSAAFTTIELRASDGDRYGLDNITYVAGSGPTGAVPEPATWALMFIGFAGMGYGMRRSRKVAVSFS